jgi:hypothetical protein
MLNIYKEISFVNHFFVHPFYMTKPSQYILLNFCHCIFFIIIISLLHRSFQLLTISLDLRLLASISCSRPAQIVTPPGLWAPYTSFTETRSPLQKSFTPAVAGSMVNMASPLPLQPANTVYYVGDFSSLPDHLVLHLIPQRNPEHSSFHSPLFHSDLELVDQPFRECPHLSRMS